MLVVLAPVVFRAPRLSGASVGRDGVTASALAGGPPQWQGLRATPRCRALSVAAPPPARRARRGVLSDAPFRVRSRGARAAEVRPALCSAALSSHGVCRVAGVAGWRAHHGVGEAHGRGWRALRLYQVRGSRATRRRAHSTLGGAGQAGRGPVAGHAAAGEVRRAQAHGRGGGADGGAGAVRHAGCCGRHRQLQTGGVRGGRKHCAPLCGRGLSPRCANIARARSGREATRARCVHGCND